MAAQPSLTLLRVHAAFAAVAVPFVQGEVPRATQTAATEAVTPDDSIAPISIVVPELGSPQPPAIEDQDHLELLLRKDPAISLSRGSLTVGNDGHLSLAGGDYWLQHGFQGSTLELVAPDEVLIWAFQWLGTNPPGAANELALVARREIWHRALLQLDGVKAELELEGRFEVAAEEELASKHGRAAGPLDERIQRGEYRVFTGTPPRAELGRDHGLILTLVVGNSGADPVHLAVLSVGEDRHHELVFPPVGTPESMTRLDSGAELRIPVRVGRDFLHVTPGYFRRPERGMLDRFFLIASREPFAYPSFREDRPPVIGEEGSPLERWVARGFCHTGDLLKTPRVGADALDLTQVGVSYVDLIVN